MATDNKIENVSDTALWVAVYRAEESARPDAIFKDPLAAKLAGSRGREIAESMPNARIMRWVMVVRTTAIDRLIMKAISEGVDTVLNLGAGADTRPYRMKLPASLRWVEVDFSNMIDLKNDRLAGEKPVCRLERHAVDLSRHADRTAFLSRINAESKKILVITEGVLIYLSNADASALAKDLHANGNIAFWIQDYYNSQLSRFFRGSIRKKMTSAPLQFMPGKWFDFFAERGWVAYEKITSSDEGDRIGRKFPIPFPWSIVAKLLPIARPRRLRDFSGYALLKRKS